MIARVAVLGAGLLVAEPNTDDAKFVAPTSMRDVEETAHLWIERRRPGGKGEK